MTPPDPNEARRLHLAGERRRRELARRVFTAGMTDVRAAFAELHRPRRELLGLSPYEAAAIGGEWWHRARKLYPRSAMVSRSALPGANPLAGV